MSPLSKLTMPLLLWYREHARVLPWRETKNPYHIWVSEIMLQQTRVSAVIDYYKRFIAALPDIAALAACPEDKLLKLWQGLGYYNRVKNMQKAAQEICTQYGGQFPREYAQIRALPGIGDYTAGAICSIAYALPYPAVDGNVMRVVARILAREDDIMQAKTKREFTALLQKEMPQDFCAMYNQALMELGALVCIPNGAPLCHLCPASTFCLAHKHSLTHKIPVKAKKKARRIEQRTVFLFFSNRHVALSRRETGVLSRLWEFPNAELTPQQALKQWNLSDVSVSSAGAAVHIFTHLEWHMSAFTGEISMQQAPSHWVWVTAAQLKQEYAVPSAFAPFLDKVFDEIGHWN